MDLSEALKIIREVADNGVRLAAIEEKLGLPLNNLSGYLNQTRKVPKKYEKKLIKYAQDNHIVPTAPAASTTPPTPPEEKKMVVKKPILQDTVGRKLPPPGLSRTEIMKWHRINQQTLD